VLQALVNPPHDGNNLSFDGGDERTDGSDDNTVVIANPRDSEPPVPIQQWMNPAIVENIHILEKKSSSMRLEWNQFSILPPITMPTTLMSLIVRWIACFKRWT
jgi:hypothetical protein